MAQSLSIILVHLVFSTKNWRPLITDDIRPELHAYMGSIFRDEGSPVIIIGSVSDHGHILFNLSRRITLGQLTELVKANSSRWIKTKGNAFKDFHWQTGYGAFSVSQSNVEAVKRYIANQAIHHRKLSFQDELRLLLDKHGIVYDERYLWD